MINKYFYEVFENIPHQGPGSNIETEKAYNKLKNLPQSPKILDIGCGNGVQTIELARLSNGYITALDNNPPFLKKLEKDFTKKNYSDYRVVLGDMAEMSFEKNEFDVIWAEGSIFIIGVSSSFSTHGRL